MDPSIEAETAARGSAPATGQPRAAHLTVTVGPGPAGARLLVPTGIETPHDRIANVSLEGGVIEDHATAAGLALGALRVRATADEIVVRYEVRAPERAAYPEIAFAPRQSRHTTAAQDLARASSTIAADAGGGEDGIAALVEEARSRFDYGHPETRFNDGPMPFRTSRADAPRAPASTSTPTSWRAFVPRDTRQPTSTATSSRQSGAASRTTCTAGW